MSDEDVDLYSDLVSIDAANAVPEIDEEKVNLKNLLEKREEELEIIKGKNCVLEKEKKTLENNISSLYKTAVNELKKKEAVIVELTRQKDSILFRRGKRQIAEVRTTPELLTNYNDKPTSNTKYEQSYPSQNKNILSRARKNVASLNGTSSISVSRDRPLDTENNFSSVENANKNIYNGIKELDSENVDCESDLVHSSYEKPIECDKYNKVENTYEGATPSCIITLLPSDAKDHSEDRDLIFPRNLPEEKKERRSLSSESTSDERHRYDYSHHLKNIGERYQTRLHYTSHRPSRPHEENRKREEKLKDYTRRYHDGHREDKRRQWYDKESNYRVWDHTRAIKSPSPKRFRRDGSPTKQLYYHRKYSSRTSPYKGKKQSDSVRTAAQVKSKYSKTFRERSVSLTPIKNEQKDSNISSVLQHSGNKFGINAVRPKLESDKRAMNKRTSSKNNLIVNDKKGGNKLLHNIDGRKTSKESPSNIRTLSNKKCNSNTVISTNETSNVSENGERKYERKLVSGTDKVNVECGSSNFDMNFKIPKKSLELFHENDSEMVGQMKENLTEKKSSVQDVVNPNIYKSLNTVQGTDSTELKILDKCRIQNNLINVLMNKNNGTKMVGAEKLSSGVNQSIEKNEISSFEKEKKSTLSDENHCVLKNSNTTSSVEISKNISKGSILKSYLEDSSCQKHKSFSQTESVVDQCSEIVNPSASDKSRPKSLPSPEKDVDVSKRVLWSLYSTPLRKLCIPAVKVSPTFEDPAAVKESKFSYTVFNEQCDFKRHKRKRSVRLSAGQVQDETAVDSFIKSDEVQKRKSDSDFNYNESTRSLNKESSILATSPTSVASKSGSQDKMSKILTNTVIDAQSDFTNSLGLMFTPKGNYVDIIKARKNVDMSGAENVVCSSNVDNDSTSTAKFKETSSQADDLNKKTSACINKLNDKTKLGSSVKSNIQNSVKKSSYVSLEIKPPEPERMKSNFHRKRKLDTICKKLKENLEKSDLKEEKVKSENVNTHAFESEELEKKLEKTPEQITVNSAVKSASCTSNTSNNEMVQKEQIHKTTIVSRFRRRVHNLQDSPTRVLSQVTSSIK